MRCRSFFYAACAAALSAFPAHADGDLSGWGDYRFGMTLEEAIAVPGLSFEEGYTSSVRPEKALRATNEAQIGGMPFYVGLTFWTGEGHGEGWLKQIYMGWDRLHMPQSACRQKGADIQKQLEARYGPFTPRPAGGTTLIDAQRNWDEKSLWIRTYWLQEGAVTKCGVDLVYSGGEAPVIAPATPDTHQF